MEASQKDLAKQHVVTNIQRHQLSEMHLMVEWITCPIIHGKLRPEEPLQWLVVDDMGAKRRGEHVIQLSTNGMDEGFHRQVSCWWQSWY